MMFALQKKNAAVHLCLSAERMKETRGRDLSELRYTCSNNGSANKDFVPVLHCLNGAILYFFVLFKLCRGLGHTALNSLEKVQFAFLNILTYFIYVSR